MSASTPLVLADSVSVAYGQKLANDRVSLAIPPGEVVALLGENGAGKSTLLHALYGLCPLASGNVFYGGQQVVPSPERAIAAGIGLIHQHFLLVPTLTVAENIVLGKEPTRFGVWLKKKKANEEVAALAEKHGLSVDPTRVVEKLSVGEAQRVEILKALYRGARVLLLDEPTAVLTPKEAERLLASLRGLLAQNDGIARAMVLVTHKLDEVLHTADRAVVMRGGRVVTELEQRDFSVSKMAHAMVGRALKPVVRTHSVTGQWNGGTQAPGSAAVPPALSIRNLCVERDGVTWVRGVSLNVAPFRIVGIAGVLGNGQRELIEAIAGLLPCKSGTICLGSRDVTTAPTDARLKLGLALVPEDRHKHGLVLLGTLAENLLLGHEERFCKGPFGMFLDAQKLHRQAEKVLEDADVRPAQPEAVAQSLSGGNQQKLLLARALNMGDSVPKVLLAAQPTRGVDLGAIEAISEALLAARDKGCAILLVSSELSELQALADELYVMYRGELVTHIENDPERPVSREQLGEWMAGVGTAVAS
ncbi:MAG TPA: ABC transporter ATP-binding protein [Pseudomonadota bacterium]|nr:ABC transporter ATP-binding protein [Pseudomonadota bacterium]